MAPPPGRVTQAGAGALTLGNISNLTTLTQAGAGTLTTGTVTNITTITQNASTGQLTLGPTIGIGTLTDNNTSGGTTPLLVNESGAGLTIGTVSGASGSVVSFGGDGTGSTTIANTLNSAGQLFKLTAGTVTLSNARNNATNIEVDGGTLIFNNTRYSTSTNNETFKLAGGTVQINSNSGFGARLNGDNGGNGAGTAGATFTGTQTSGTFNILQGGQYAGFNLGSNSATQVSTYNLSGGLLEDIVATTNGYLDLGADTGGTSITTFNFSGGKLLLSYVIEGDQGAGAKQAFVWTGGQLSVLNYQAANLTSVSGAAYAGNVGTLTNAGGILAPGDTGMGGLTAITGNYAVTSGNASYAVDIGSATAASTFQSGVAFYDKTTVSGATTLGGKLNVTPINSYTPVLGTNYNIMVGSSGGITGNFTNLVTGTNGSSRVVLANGLSSLIEAYNNTGSAANVGGLTAVGAYTVALGGYQATNRYVTATGGSWDAANAASWSYFDPGSTSSPSTVASGAIADFADGGATGGAVTNTVNLNSTRNIQGILFASATTGKSYAINNAGSGAIILDNTGNSAAATINDTSVNGQNSIGVPITLNSNLNVGITNAAASDTISGIISGPGETLTKSGAGTLNLSGANTYSGLTTVSAGALNITGTVAGALTVNAGTVSVGSNALVSGSAIVNGGTLKANGLLNSTVTIGSAGTLTGAGTIGGLLTLNAGASTINLVDGSAGTLTLDNGLTLNGGNNLDFDLGASNDTISLAGGAFSFAGSNDLISITKIIGSTITSGTYNLITGATGISASNFVLSGTTLGGQYLSLAASGGNLQLIAVSAGLGAAYWSGALDTNWNTLTSGSSNWNTDQTSGINAGAIPLPATDVYFAANGVSSPINTTLGANFSIDSLNFLANVGTVTIGGANSLTIAASGITNAAGNSVTLNPEMTVILGASQTWTNSSALMTVASTVTDSGSGFTLSISGSGVTVLSGANSYAGNILNNGELSVSSDSNLGGASNALTFNGGTLQVTGNSLTSFGSHTVTFNNGQNVGLDINSASNVFTVSQVLNQGGGGLTLYGAGTVALTASNTYTGNTTINAGTLQLGNGGTAFNGSIASTSGVVNDGTTVFDDTGTQSVAGGVSGTGSVSVIGSGTTTLAGVNSFTGGITVTPGATLSLTGNSTAVSGSVMVRVTDSRRRQHFEHRLRNPDCRQRADRWRSQ